MWDLDAQPVVLQPMFPDADAFDRINNGDEADILYVRDRHPNGLLLAEQLAALEGASWVVLFGSGMAAITVTRSPLRRRLSGTKGVLVLKVHGPPKVPSIRRSGLVRLSASIAGSEA
jgi:cystathionine beta-lyase/cystathionine gamma-synthase